MEKKIIVLGKGFLGRKFEKKGFKVWGRNKFEIERSSISMDTLELLDKYDVVINCIAKSNTRWCEKKENFREAMWSNGEIPRILSHYCDMSEKKFVHISTGCLYDTGSDIVPYNEGDFMSTHCNYTVTKWVGEKGLSKNDLILRPRLLFGDFKNKNNLLCKLPKFTHFLDEAYNSYISVNVLIDVIMVLIKNNQSGIFNCACDGIATIKELAEWIGLEGEGISEEELRKSEKIFLVNNIMNISKLKKFFKPPKLKDEILRCWERLNEK